MADKMAAQMKKTLKTFSIQNAHLSVDIQLYHIACIVQWSDSYCWTSLVLHPGMMHTLMSFIGCIQTLMKESCVDMLLIVAFGRVAGIITVKWTNALRALPSHYDSFAPGFLPEWHQYVPGVARVQGGSLGAPVEMLWVYCLTKLF